MIVSAISRLVLVGLLSLVQADKSATDNSTSAVFRTLKHFLSSRQDAATFSAQKRGYSKENLREECCTGDGCHWEEHHEMAEENGETWVLDKFYELSLAESDRHCRCRNWAKNGWYECGIGRGTPCRRKDQFHCGDNNWDKKCVSNDAVCDSNNDCGNWKDEGSHCKFAEGSVVILQKPSLGWFCAVHMQRGILAKTTDLAEARSALGSTGSGSNRQAIIPMSLTTAGDPHTLAKSWSGGSMWWGDNDIEKMQATCRDSKGPGFKPSVLAETMRCCSTPKCTEYRGTKSTTASGKTCQAWNSHYPHKHYQLTPAKRPSFGMESNYCRNPDGERSAWCYTTDSGTRYELCGIPFCAGSCMTEDNMNYGGNDIRMILVDSKEECQEGCLQETKCAGFTFVKSKSNGKHECWLKHKMQNKNGNNNCFSGFCSPNGGPGRTSGANAAVTNAATNTNSPGSHYGNVIIGGRPVCDDTDDWDDKDAKVVCKNLGYEDDVKAFAVRSSKFGKVPLNFLIAQVKCEGTESKLRDCTYTTKTSCGEQDGAGVVCIDPKKIKLVPSSAQRFGDVYVGSYPIGHTNWGTNEAQVACNSIYRDKFAERKSSQVPVYETTTQSRFSRANTDEIIMDQVRCTGNEARLTDCQFVTHDRETVGRSQVAGVRCAKCTPKDLLSILASVTIGNSIADSRKSVDNALNQLKSQCYKWDCSVRIPVYPEYCQLLAFFDEARKIVTADFRKQALLGTTFHQGGLLKHQFLNMQTNKLLVRIDDVAAQGADFQTKMAGFQTMLANFDRDKAKADYSSANQDWSEQRQSVKDIQAKLGPDLSELFKYAFDAQGADMIHRTAQLALSVLALASPADAVFNPGEMAEKASTIIDRTAELADSLAEKAKLGFTFAETLPKFKKLSQTLKTNFNKNKRVYENVAQILNINGIEDFTLAKADEFLVAYNDYTPPMSVEHLATYKVLIDQIVDNTCEVLNAPGGVIKALIKLRATKICPTIQQNVEIVKDLLDAMGDSQLEVMDTFADFARAKVSEMAARDLSQVLGRKFANILEGKIASKRAGVLFQIHKIVLINNACDYIKYINYGVEKDICVPLRGNTFSSIDKLSNFRYDDDWQCIDSYSRRGTFNIPAAVRRRGETLPKGTLDITRLLDPAQRRGSMMFQIPNTQWLVDNGWIYGDEINQGPFFVKKLQLFPPPSLANRQADVRTKFTLVDNTLDKEVYLFDKSINADFSMQERIPYCDDNHYRKSRYNLLNCQPLENVCVRSDGLFPKPVYPSLMALWNIDFFIPAILKQAQPFPVGTMNFKVEAEICFRKKDVKREVLRVKPKKNITTRAASQTCCADSGKYTNANQECESCPVGSSPRLNGYYCESCPSGTAPRNPGVASYGCVQCPVNQFKNGDGNSECSPCPAQTHTDGNTGSSLCAPLE